MRESSRARQVDGAQHQEQSPACIHDAFFQRNEISQAGCILLKIRAHRTKVCSFSSFRRTLTPPRIQSERDENATDDDEPFDEEVSPINPSVHQEGLTFRHIRFAQRHGLIKGDADDTGHLLG